MNDEAHIFPPWRLAVQHALQQFAPGDVIPNEWLDSEFELESPELGTIKEFESYKLARLRARDLFRDKLLCDHKVYLRTIHGVGLEWVRPGEQTKAAVDRKEADFARSIMRAKEGLSFIDYDALTDIELRINRDALAVLAAAEAFNQRSIAARPKTDSLPPPDEEGGDPIL